MKTLYISNGSNILIDTEENTANTVDSQREAIQRIYLAEEPMHVVYGSGEYKREVDVKKDDIIVTFYTDDFENRIVVVKNKDWANNLKKYNKRQQEIKEQWAAA
jgi:hypothetical protein